MEQVITGHFTNHERAEVAVRALTDAGFSHPNISIVAQNLQASEQVQVLAAHSDAHPPTLLLSTIGGLLLGAAALTLPGVGPLLVAGPLAANFFGVLDGAVLGTSSGGLMGALMGYGLPRDTAQKYQTAVENGGFLVMAHGDANQIKLAQGVLEHQEASDLEVVPENGEISNLV